MTSWTVILGVAVGSYALRLSMLSVLAGRTVPGWIDRCLTVVGPAAVGAIAAGMLFVERGQRSLSLDPMLIAAVSGYIAVRRTGRMTDSLIVGFPVLWIATALA